MKCTGSDYTIIHSEALVKTNISKFESQNELEQDKTFSSPRTQHLDYYEKLNTI